MINRFDQMKELLLQLNPSTEPTYRRLADALRDAIRTGHVRPGETIPSTRVLAGHLKIHRHTVMTAINELIAEGWIESSERSRYRVAQTLPTRFLTPLAAAGRPSGTRPTTIRLARRAADLPTSGTSTAKYRFPSGLPDLRLFPVERFKSHVYSALQKSLHLGYENPAGHERLIHEVGHYLRRVRRVTDRSIVMTHGSQEAIYILAQLLLRAGDNVAVEALGYPPAFEALRYSGARLLPVKVDEQGLVPSDLRRLLRRTRIRVLYLTPLHQYPTTSTLSASRRLEIYELACEHDFLILEDDYDHEFHFDSQPMAPMASFDPAGRILYVGTFSKIMFPAARLGYMAVSPTIAAEASRLKRISTRQNNAILEAALASWIHSGEFETHLRKMRRVYHERRDSFVADLDRLQERHPKLSWSRPDGGMALWLNVGQDSSELAELAARHSIEVAPERQFRLDQREGTHLRLGYSGLSSQANIAALGALAQIL